MKNTILKIGRLAFMALPILALVGVSTQAKADTCSNQSVAGGLNCTLGNLDFSFSQVTVQPGTNPVTLIPGMTGTNMPGTGDTQLGFQFALNTTDIDMFYSVSTIDGSKTISGVDSSFGAIPGAISETVCSVAFVGDTCPQGDQLTMLLNTSGQIEFSDPFGPVSEIFIHKDISPEGPNSDATDSVVSTSPVPEPSSLALLGTTLLGAAGVARRRLKVR